MADVVPSPSFELTIDLMLYDQALASSNYIVRLIYQISQVSSSGRIEEALTSFMDHDQINKVVYSIKGISKSFRIVRNICMDACKGLKLNKCEMCLRPTNQLAIFNLDRNNSYAFVSLFYKVYQISLKGQGVIENATLSDRCKETHFELAKKAVDYLLDSQNRTSGGWPINVARKFDQASRTYLNLPWYSAMAQVILTQTNTF